MKRQLIHTYNNIISPENLLGAWREFARGKHGKPDVQEFSLRLMDNIFQLHNELKTQTYHHGHYHHFRICDPKPRDIHKANVRDRLVHHAIYRALYWFYHPLFIADSYSCRLGKGTHKALNCFRAMAYQTSRNHTWTCWVLRGDIKQFFASIDHQVLLSLLCSRIPDVQTIWLLSEIVDSFHSTQSGIGLPLGNLTSQLFVNVYMNEFDQLVKTKLRIKHYLRYADDFAILLPDRDYLINLIPTLQQFLTQKLKLTLHPRKVTIKTVASGVDFLGWVHFTDHRVLRSATRRRMIKRLTANPQPATAESYRGLLKWGNAYKLKEQILTY